MDKLIEHSENLDSPTYRTSDLQNPIERYEYFVAPNIGTKVRRPP